jgi:predicted O-linked N-acetylglucosamine transferase (SPINDLY family)
MPAPPPKALMDRAQSLLRQGDHAQAEGVLRRALASSPQDWLVNHWLAEALFFLGKHDQAVTFAKISARVAPNNPAGWSLLGQCLMRQGKLAEALEPLRKATQLAPDDSMTWNSLGVCHMMREEMELALEPVEKAMSLAPADPLISINYARILHAHCQVDRSLALLTSLQTRHPADPDLLSHLVGQSNYASSLAPERKLEYARLLGAIIERPEVLARRPLHRVTDIGAARPLRIGLLSHDLRAHSVAHFVQPLLQHVDRARATLHCFSTSAAPDAVSTFLSSLVDSWHDLAGKPHDAAAKTIADARIDVLIELGGNTMGNGLDLCPFRPAPLQATAIGYPGTLGMRTVTHRLVDAITDPPATAETDSDSWFSEQLVRIEGCFLCYDPALGDAALPPPRSAPRNDARPIRFGSFNNPSKITRDCLALWADVLRSVEGSTLLLKGYAMGGEVAPRYIKQAMSELGIDPARIECAGRMANVDHHLRAYDRIDIALDTWPYVGTTTTCEALLMGVPVVTLPGLEHVSRVGASLLAHAGLPELIAPDREGFARIAAALAQDRPRLAAYHATLRDRLLASALCDGKSYASRWLDAVERTWRSLPHTSAPSGRERSEP